MVLAEAAPAAKLPAHQTVRYRTAHLALLGAISTALALAALAQYVLIARSEVAFGAWLYLAATILVIVTVLFADRRSSAIEQVDPIGSFAWATPLAIAALIALAAVLRLWNLEGLPSGIHGDETEFGMATLAILAGRGAHPLGTVFLGDPALFAYLQAPFVALLGTTIEALRVGPALAGTLGVAAHYALVRSMFGAWPALMATAFLVGAAVHLHFSRMGLNVAHVPLTMSLSLLLLWRGFRRGGARWWIASGIVAGLGMYFHFGARMLPIIVGLWLVWLTALRPSCLRAYLRGALAFAVGTAVAVAPSIMHHSGRFNQLTEHVQGRIIFQDLARATAQHRTSDPVEIVLAQLALNLDGLVHGNDASTFFTFTGAPLLSWLAAPLAVLGLALLTARLCQPGFALLWFWFWTVIVVGGALTWEPPQFHRLWLALPPALTAAALFLTWAGSTCTAGLGAPIRRILLASMALVPVAASASDAHAYFGPYATGYPWADVTALGRSAAAYGPDARVFVVARPWMYASHGNVRYLNNSGVTTDLVNPSMQLDRPAGRPLVFLVNQGLPEWLELLRSTYPKADVVPVDHPPGKAIFTAIVVPPEDGGTPWTEQNGLAGELKSEDQAGATLGRADGVVAWRELALINPRDRRPFTATWRGQLIVPTEGVYELELYSDGPSVLRVDEHSLANDDLTPDRPRSIRYIVRLAAGLHTIEAEYRWTRGPGIIELRWKPPNGPRSIIPPSALRPP